MKSNSNVQVKEFVITQHPTAETRDAFWTMLWDHNAQTVVLLTPLTQTTAVFWPVKHEEYDLDYFKVFVQILPLPNCCNKGAIH